MGDIFNKVKQHALRNTDGCLEWLGALNGKVPIVSVGGRKKSIRRLVWNEIHPEDPAKSNEMVMIRCKCRSCIEPEHYYKVGRAGDPRDADAKQRKDDESRLPIDIDDEGEDLEGPDILTKWLTPQRIKSLAQIEVSNAMANRHRLDLAWAGALA